MTEFVSGALMLMGALFVLIAGIGLVRMPDLFLRMSAVAKAGTLGVGSILLAVALASAELGPASRAIATIVFVALTTPVAAHMLARAAYFVGVPLWEGTHTDELRGHYDKETHVLESPSDVIDTAIERDSAPAYLEQARAPN